MICKSSRRARQIAACLCWRFFLEEEASCVSRVWSQSTAPRRRAPERSPDSARDVGGRDQQRRALLPACRQIPREAVCAWSTPSHCRSGFVVNPILHAARATTCADQRVGADRLQRRARRSEDGPEVREYDGRGAAENRRVSDAGRRGRIGTERRDQDGAQYREADCRLRGYAPVPTSRLRRAAGIGKHSRRRLRVQTGSCGRKAIQDANELYKKRQYAQAVELFERAQALVPELPAAQQGDTRACRCRRTGDTACALEAFSKLKQIALRDPRGDLMYMQTLFRRRRLRGAGDDLPRRRTSRSAARRRGSRRWHRAATGLLQAGQLGARAVVRARRPMRRPTDAEAQYRMGGPFQSFTVARRRA